MSPFLAAYNYYLKLLDEENEEDCIILGLHLTRNLKFFSTNINLT
jgi:hypothetical protein